MSDGTILVDASRLNASEHLLRWMLGLAVGGDIAIAQLLVVEGTLSTWLANGTAVASNRAATAEKMNSVMTWVRSAYGFFADGMYPCPDE